MSSNRSLISFLRVALMDLSVVTPGSQEDEPPTEQAGERRGTRGDEFPALDEVPFRVNSISRERPSS